MAYNEATLLKDIETNFPRALAGTLWSTPPTASDKSVASFHIYNNTEVPIRLIWLDYLGRHNTHCRLRPNQNAEVKGAYATMYFLVTNALSGAFMAAFKASPGGKDISFTCHLLTTAGRIGPFPQPYTNLLIPPNSPLVLIACARLPGNKIITREQGWVRQPDSFSLAPNEKRTVSLTVTRGLQRTSSSSETFSTAIGMSGSAGWGPVSASVSSSLSYTSTSFQQVTISEETSVYESKEFQSSLPEPSMFLVWQLVDVITVYNEAENPIASLSLGESPALISPAYSTATVKNAIPVPSASVSGDQWKEPEFVVDRPDKT
jgi:hypothetical protein